MSDSDDLLSDAASNESDLSDLSAADSDELRPRARSQPQRYANQAAAAQGSTRSKKKKAQNKGMAWEGGFERTWDAIREDERGTLEGAINDELLGSKTRR